MKKPYKYTVVCNKTGKVLDETNILPQLHRLQTWEPTEDPKVSILTQTKTVWIDTRYEARLRLYNYVTFTKNGASIPSYNPFEDTQIGKSIPILNF